jgi:hypothetical protein
MDNNPASPQEQLRASLGMHVVVDLVFKDGGDRLEFDIVPDNQADFSHGFLGVGTPLAQAVLGRTAHSVIPYKVDDGLEVRILSVSPSQKAPSEDAQARHEELIRKAIEHSDRTNAMIFASSFSGKWGDYDPTGFAEDDSEKAKGKDLPKSK